MLLKSLLLLLAAVMVAFVVGGCSEDDNPSNPGTPTSTSYTGVMAGTGVSGTLAIVIPPAKMPAAPVTVMGDTIAITGTLKINGGATITLAGTYIVSTGAIYLTGGGYTFTGMLSDGSITGTFTYSGGDGIFACDEGTSSTVKTYCGHYADNSPGTETGTFNMTINGANIFVLVYPDGAGGASFATTGSINAEHQISIYNPENPSIVVATGTLNPASGHVSGTYAGDYGGTWSGDPCN